MLKCVITLWPNFVLTGAHISNFNTLFRTCCKDIRLPPELADATRCAIAGIDTGLMLPPAHDLQCMCTSIVGLTCHWYSHTTADLPKHLKIDSTAKIEDWNLYPPNHPALMIISQTQFKVYTAGLTHGARQFIYYSSLNLAGLSVKYFFHLKCFS